MIESAREDVFAARRLRLKNLLLEEASGCYGAALFFSGDEHGLDFFSPSPNFYYFTGVETPGSALLITLAPQRATETLFLPAPDPARERWMGKVLNAGGLTPAMEPDPARCDAMRATGLATVSAYHQLEESLIRPLRPARILYLDLPEDAILSPVGMAQEFAERVRRRYPAMEIRDAGRLAGELRRVKDSQEVMRMREAAAITAEAHLAIARCVQPGLHEYELQAAAEFVFTARGAQAKAFPTIIGSGINSCYLHYQKNSRLMSRGELVVCDIGCKKDYYCADLTRTYPVSGRFTKRQARVYDMVLEAQAAAIAAAKPGARLRDLHEAAMGLFEKRKVARYYFHGTSHYLGLTAHDSGSGESPLEPGVVITVEPGLYIAEESLGIRIEDDVLITEGGAELLADLPRERSAIERLLATRRRKIVI